MQLHHLFLLLALLIPLSFDTFLLAAALGLAGLPKQQQIRTSLTLAAFEAGMPIVGVLIGHGLGHFIGKFAGYTAAIVIGLAGLIALKPGDNDEKEQQQLKLLAHARGLAVVDLGLSISIDELAVGVSLGLLHVPLVVTVIFLGVQSFVASQLGLRLGGQLSEGMRGNAERAAGLVLITVAVALVVLKITGHGL